MNGTVSSDSSTSYAILAVFCVVGVPIIAALLIGLLFGYIWEKFLRAFFYPGASLSQAQMSSEATLTELTITELPIPKERSEDANLSEASFQVSTDGSVDESRPSSPPEVT